MPKNFYQIAAATSKDVEIAGVRIALQSLLDLQGQTIHPPAHIRRSTREPYPYA